ncbi:MAG: hypothetical protein ACI9G1_002779, partial [Pirellulaceae bacterium]
RTTFVSGISFRRARGTRRRRRSEGSGSMDCEDGFEFVARPQPTRITLRESHYANHTTRITLREITLREITLQEITSQ